MKEAHLHHPWCNFFNRPRKDCTMCERLFKLYPLTDDMIGTYFPTVVIRKQFKDKD